MKIRTALALIAILASATLTGCATTGQPTSTQRWALNQPVTGGGQDAGGGAHSKNTLTLWRAAGVTTTGEMKITGQITDRCLLGSLDVAIEERTDVLVLIPKSTMATCYDTRISIRKDGTGGTVERRAFKSKEYVMRDFDFDLTPR